MLMLAFGHIGFALFLLYILTNNAFASLVLAPLSILPDIDLILGIKHRGITHTMLFSVVVFLVALIWGKLWELRLNLKEYIIISTVLQLSHIIADIIGGNGIEIFPGIRIESIFPLTPELDAIFGGIFYLLFLLMLKLRPGLALH